MGVPVSGTYVGLKLQTHSQAGITTRYLYGSAGNTDCTVSTYSGKACPAPGHVDLIDDSVYDYLKSLVGYRYYNGAASATKTSDYTIDPLERPIRQVDWVSPNTTTIMDFTYVGVTSALSKEVHTYGTWSTKAYAYDVFGNRSTISDKIGGNPPDRYSSLYDPHSSVSLLIDQANVVKASYGYSAYGAANAALTRTASGFDSRTNPLPLYGKAARLGVRHLRHGSEALLGFNGAVPAIRPLLQRARQPRARRGSAHPESLRPCRRQPCQLRRGGWNRHVRRSTQPLPSR